MKEWFGSAAICINEDKEVLMVKSSCFYGKSSNSGD